MTVQEVLTDIRRRINDSDQIEYDDNELMDYLNSSISYLSNYLISKKDPRMVKEITRNTGDPIPSDFISFAGTFPVAVIGDMLKTTNGTTTQSFRYFATKPYVTSLNAVIPFSDQYIPILKQLVCIYALNRNEFDIGQDNTILQALQSVMEGIKFA